MTVETSRYAPRRRIPGWLARCAIACAVSACGDCTNDAEHALMAPAVRERQLWSISRGDRVLTVDARLERRYEGALRSGGRLPGVQRAGVRRRLSVVDNGAIGDAAPGELARWVDSTVLESDTEASALDAMNVDDLAVEACEGPTPTERVAFRLRSRGGHSFPGAPDRFIGAFLLSNTVTPMVATIDADDCDEALAAMPADAEAWLAAELGAAADENRLPRTGAMTRDGRVEARERPGVLLVSPIVAATEERQPVALLRWALRSLEVPDPVQRFLGTRVASDPAVATALIDAMDPASDVSVDAHAPGVLELIDVVPTEGLAATVGGPARSIATICRARGEETRCSHTRLVGAGRLAARSEDEQACDALAGLVVALGTAREPGAERGRARVELFREVATCASPDGSRAAALDMATGPYDYVDGVPWTATCFGAQAASRCQSPALVGAMWLAERCTPEVARRARDAAPRAQMDQKHAIACVLAACEGEGSAREAIATMPAPSGAEPHPSGSRCWSASPER
jgi:hypothetical protein